MPSIQRQRGIALISVLLATALLLTLVAVLVDIGTLQLQKSTAELRAVQALAGADGGTAWVRAVLEQQQGDVNKTILKLGATQGKRRFVIDDRTYVVASVTLQQPQSGSSNDHYDANLEQNLSVNESPLQVVSSAAVYVDSVPVTRRVTTSLLRLFPAAPYSAIVGYIDDGSPVGIDSPGDAGGQFAGLDSTELLVHAYTMNQIGLPHRADKFGNASWTDFNSAGPGPLP